MHCDVWNGFVFINFDPEPRQTLRDFLGPMITALDDYPFELMTERYDFVAHNNSNWKIFADAFQEYYHVPSLHSQQVPTEVRQPNQTFECGHFQIDGPHRLVSTAGTRRWLLAPEYMYPVERATRSGWSGPWRTPETHQSAGLNPGGIEPWGITNFQIFPNLEILIYHGWYLLYRYWPTSHNTHKFEAYNAFHPARTVRERIEHEVASVVLKEFALQDAGMLGGTQAALEYDVVDDFPLNDQEILVRHLHKVAVDWVERVQERARTGGGVIMAGSRLPSAFAEFEPFAEKWCLATEPERWEARLTHPDAGDPRVLRRVLPAVRGGDRLLRQVPARRRARRRAQPAAPHLFDGHGLDGRRGLRYPEARRLRRRRHRPRQRAGALTDRTRMTLLTINKLTESVGAEVTGVDSGPVGR